MSQYVRTVPSLLADMERQREEDQKQQTDEISGESEIVLHRYHVEGGGVILSTTPLEDEPQPPIVDSQHPRKEPSFFEAVLLLISILTLSFLIAIGILTPYQQPEQRALLRVPAVLLPLKTFATSVAVVPTGVKTYPATTAHGILTIKNGSILTEELPKGMILTGNDGAEVITDQAVFVPAGSAAGYGIAYVSAHAAVTGAAGNIPSLDIDTVEGTALYIRNQQPFKDGADRYSVKFISPQDKETALSKARSTLLPQTLNGLLESPCKETITGVEKLLVRWTCQFVSYSVPDLPGVRVLSAEVKGQMIILDVVFVVRPRILTTK